MMHLPDSFLPGIDLKRVQEQQAVLKRERRQKRRRERRWKRSRGRWWERSEEAGIDALFMRATRTRRSTRDPVGPRTSPSFEF